MSLLKVLSITEFDKKKRKVLLSEDLALVLYPGDLRKYQIEEGSSLSAESVQEITNLLCRRARERVMGLLEISDKTEFELRSRLKREGYPEEAVEKALEAVRRYGYVNDEAYSQRYAQNRSRSKSRLQIVNGLMQKGIEREKALEILEEIPIDEEGQIRRLLEQKGYWGRKLERKEMERAAGMLARRGYSFDAIRKALNSSDTEWMSGSI